MEGRRHRLQIGQIAQISRRNATFFDELPVVFPKELWHIPVGNQNGGAMKQALL
jgi:hypothetical protein